MKNYVKIDYANRQIIMDRTFAWNAKIVGSEEYNLLQTARRDYEGFHVITRTIRRNEKKECYRGLTYDYMERYILTHDNAEERMKEFNELRLIAECHSKRYPVIKKWFLQQYPEIAQFGMPDITEEAPAAAPMTAASIVSAAPKEEAQVQPAA